MDELLKDFLAETAESIDSVGAQLVQFERDPSDARIIGNIFRLVHTIKGTCGFIGLPRLEKIAHAAEALISRLREGAPASAAMVSLILAAIDRIRFILQTLEEAGVEPDGADDDLIAAIEREALGESSPAPARAEATETAEPFAALAPAAHEGQLAPQREAATIRVAVTTIERIMTLVSELVLTRNQLLEIARHRDDDGMKGPLQRLSTVTTDLQEGVMHARMQPMDRLFGNLPRLVRDLAADLDKRIELVVSGGDVELDRQLIELIRDPITHLIRNCADHGLESEQERARAGKRQTGTIRISAAHEAGYITIDVGDDGRGIDVARIREKAAAQGLASEADIARMSNEDVCRFIFAPGFSTAAQVTSISGRGVGMDVVRENIEAIGGTVSLVSTAGGGTTFTLKIPLTLAIAPALIVRSCGHRFALPQHAVIEAVSIWDENGGRIENVHGALMLRIRENVIPVIDLRALLRLDAPHEADEQDRLAVIMRFGANAFGVVVDAVSDVQEIVVKPLSRSLAHLMVFSGNTILGDGAVVLILNPNGLAGQLGLDVANQYRGASDEGPRALPQAPMRLTVFRAGPGALKALPLSLVSRIETVDRSDIHEVDGVKVVYHLGRLTPVVDLGCADDPALQKLHVLVVGVGGEPMGLLVSEIVDIVESAVEIEIAGKSEAIIGSATINGEPVEILDLPYFMRLARPAAFSRGHARRFAILLVDDKPFFRDMLSPVLGAAGYHVSTAASGAEALGLLQKGHQFDALVTDIDMPGMNGYALAQRLREDPRRADMPIIALDAHAGANVITAARSAGMIGAVGKFDRAALLETLGHALQPSAFSAQSIEQTMMGEAA